MNRRRSYFHPNNATKVSNDLTKAIWIFNAFLLIAAIIQYHSFMQYFTNLK